MKQPWRAPDGFASLLPLSLDDRAIRGSAIERSGSRYRDSPPLPPRTTRARPPFFPVTSQIRVWLEGPLALWTLPPAALFYVATSRAADGEQTTCCYLPI